MVDAFYRCYNRVVRAILRLLTVFVLAAPSLAPIQASSEVRRQSPEVAVPVAAVHVAGLERPALQMSAAPGVLTFVKHAPDQTRIAVTAAAPRLRQADAHSTDRGRAPPQATPL